MRNCTHQKRIFRKTILWPLGGAALPNFLHALENDQVLLAHPPAETEPPYNFFSKWRSKIGLNCSEVATKTIKPNETLPRDVVLSGADDVSTNFCLKLMSKIVRDLGQLSTLSANISGTDRDIDKQ